MSYNGKSHAYLLCTSPDFANVEEFLADAKTATPENINTLVLWTQGKVVDNTRTELRAMLNTAESQIKNALGILEYRTPQRIKTLVVIADSMTPKGSEMLHKFTDAHQIGLIILSDN